jgi:hypothetical protein
VTRYAVSDANGSRYDVAVFQEEPSRLMYNQIPPPVQDQLDRIEALLVVLVEEKAGK